MQCCRAEERDFPRQSNITLLREQLARFCHYNLRPSNIPIGEPRFEEGDRYGGSAFLPCHLRRRLVAPPNMPFTYNTHSYTNTHVNIYNKYTHTHTHCQTETPSYGQSTFICAWPYVRDGYGQCDGGGSVWESSVKSSSSSRCTDAGSHVCK